MAKMNAHGVLTGATGKNGYLTNLDVGDKRESELRGARDKIREALRDAVPAWSSYLDKKVFFESGSSHAPPKITQPKFRLQGSMSYHTLNAPAQHPPQEVDVDDGMFLPVSFLDQGGTNHPRVLSDGLFKLVEAALLPLCKKQNWTLNTTKPSCVRVLLGTGAHVDIALYAIPDSEFSLLVETAKALDASGALVEDVGTVEFSEGFYQRLPEDHIVLAHRIEGWKPSDPRKLEDWFKAAVKDHGYQIRRVCRYLKGWRDARWAQSSLSSIALMRCVVDSYEKFGADLDDDRDDLALQRVAAALSQQLRARISNPVVQQQWLDQGWTAKEREEYATAAEELAALITVATEKSENAEKVIAQFRAEFGQRIPNDVSLVKKDDTPLGPSGGKTPSVLTSGMFHDQISQANSQPPVKKSGGDRYA